MRRWNGCGVLRRAAAPAEIPMTLERAPWVIRRALGHFGAYREGVGKIVGRLRGTFDPGQCLNVALEGADRCLTTRSPRSLRALRILPAGLPHLPGHRRRGPQPSRTHRPDARPGAGRDGSRRCRPGRPPGCVPGLSRLRARVSLRAWATAGDSRPHESSCIAQRGLSSLARTVLGVFRYRALWRPLFTARSGAFGPPACPSLLPAGAGSDSAWECWRRVRR